MTEVRAGGRSSMWFVVEYNVRAFRRYWVGVIIGGLVTPLLYVLSLGVGLGRVVNAHSGTVQGVPYLQFVAPALIASAAVQVGAGMASYPILGGFKWMRTYHAMAATPLTPGQICTGQLTFIALRLGADAVVYTAIVAALGGLHRPAGLLAIPAAVLVGTSFAALLTAWSAYVETEGASFNVVQRFIVIPMFLFSATFYPIDQLPHWARVVAYVSPLWHGTQLCRGAAVGGLSAAAALGHVAYLLALFAIGAGIARWRFTVRLTK